MKLIGMLEKLNALIFAAMPALVIAGFIIAGIMAVLSAFTGCNVVTAPARIVNKTFDADNIITQYEWFKQQHEDIAALESKIDAARNRADAFKEGAGERSTWHREDRNEHARLTSIADGLQQQRSDAAAKYNARSRMVNRSVFKAGDTELPASISVDY